MTVQHECDKQTVLGHVMPCAYCCPARYYVIAGVKTSEPELLFRAMRAVAVSARRGFGYWVPAEWSDYLQPMEKPPSTGINSQTG